MNVLVLDNHDSFTWNLVQALTSQGATCRVERSDSITLGQIEAFRPERLVLSPGPYGPSHTGICPAAVSAFSGRIPILGVCLGMQVIATVGGARVEPSGHPAHGRTSPVFHSGDGVLAGMPSPFLAARYHSLQVVPESANRLEVTAWTGDGIIMGCRLPGLRTEGVLFHPESFLTEHSARLFRNFLAG